MIHDRLFLEEMMNRVDHHRGRSREFGSHTSPQGQIHEPAPTLRLPLIRSIDNLGGGLWEGRNGREEEFRYVPRSSIQETSTDQRGTRASLV